MKMLVVLTACLAMGCATYDKIEEDLGYMSTEYDCIGVEIGEEQAICFDTIRLYVTVVW